MRGRRALKSHYILFLSKAKPVGREKNKKTIIIIVTFVSISCIPGRKRLKYHYNPVHFYTLLQFLENPLKNPLVLITYVDFQAVSLGTGGETQQICFQIVVTASAAP